MSTSPTERPLSGQRRLDALHDLGLIVRGEEANITWRRVCVLLDNELAEVNHPVTAQGTSWGLNLTHNGLRFMNEPAIRWFVGALSAWSKALLVKWNLLWRKKPREPISCAGHQRD